MRKFDVCLVLVGATVFLVGCGTQWSGHSSTRGGIAVVDLDKVATESGKSLEMNEAVRNQKASLESQIFGIRNAAVNELQADAKKLEEPGEDATAEAKKAAAEAKQALAIKTQNANTNLAKLQNNASNLLNEFQQSQVARFRNELKPIVQEAAAKRGLSVVIPKNEGLLLTVDPGVDITAEVIKAYQGKRLSAPAPALAPTTTQSAAQTAPKSASRENKDSGESAKR